MSHTVFSHFDGFAKQHFLIDSDDVINFFNFSRRLLIFFSIQIAPFVSPFPISHSAPAPGRRLADEKSITASRVTTRQQKHAGDEGRAEWSTGDSLSGSLLSITESSWKICVQRGRVNRGGRGELYAPQQ